MFRVPLKHILRHLLWKNQKKKNKTKFFKKFRTNRVWGKNRNFSKKARSSHVRPSFECCQPSSHLRGPRRGAPLVVTDGRSFQNHQNRCFLQFSRKLLNIFFQILLLPLEEFLRHLLKKIKLVKSENFPPKKFRTIFWKKIKKIVFFAKFSKNSQYFFLIFSCALRNG